MSYTGKYLHLNLTTQKHYIGETDKNLTDLYIGGKGLGFALLEKLAPNPEALGPENPLIFVNGPIYRNKSSNQRPNHPCDEIALNQFYS